MRRRGSRLIRSGWWAGVLGALACSSPVAAPPAVAQPTTDPAPAPYAALRDRARSMSPMPALAPDPTNRFADDPEAARLGQALFFQPGLTGHGEASCVSCHLPEAAFAEHKPVSLGRGRGTRNAPSVLDSAHERWFFRDGRADTLWAQALQPMESSVEMGGSRTGVVRTLLAHPSLREAYERVFDDDLTELAGLDLPDYARPVPADDGHPHALAWASLSGGTREHIDRVFVNVGKAIAAYESRLLTGPSPFDRWVAGDEDALGPQAVAGLALFVGRAGCVRCHPGPRLTDGEFHNLGVPPADGSAPRDAARFEGVRKLREDPFAASGMHSDAPDGARSLATRTVRVSGEDWGAFKTPALRNVARTAPYMHAGQLATLHDVLRYYSTLEGAMTGGHHAESTLQPLDLTEAQIDQLVAFLESLTTADPPAELMGPPTDP